MIADIFKDAQHKRIEIWVAGHLIFRSDHREVEVVKVNGESCVHIRMKDNGNVAYNYYFYPNEISCVSVAEDTTEDTAVYNPKDDEDFFLD